MLTKVRGGGSWKARPTGREYHLQIIPEERGIIPLSPGKRYRRKGFDVKWKVGYPQFLRPAASASPGTFLEMQSLRPHPRLPEWEELQSWFRSLCFNKHWTPRDSATGQHSRTAAVEQLQ